MTALLELHAVTHAYGPFETLAHLSLALEKGRIGCLLGPSGCGKTTVLRLIAGFETLREGTILLDGQAVARPGFSVPPEKRHVGMVFQDYALFPHLTVAENVAFGLRGQPAQTRRDRVDELLDLVNLPEAGQRYPHELSGGQQQRVALARALAPRPTLILLDEPFSNLDVDLRERLALEVREILKREHTTAVLVTHDQHEAFAFADDIGIMHRGAIQQWDTPYNLYHRPANRFVADFVGQGAFIPGIVRENGRIETEFGLLEGVVPPACGPGATVDVLLRPDDVAHDDGSPLKAEILHRAFRGAEILYTLRLASGRTVLAQVPSHHDHPQGEPLGIRLEADHVIAFPPEPCSP